MEHQIANLLRTCFEQVHHLKHLDLLLDMAAFLASSGRHHIALEIFNLLLDSELGILTFLDLAAIEEGILDYRIVD
jgi:hypothetical protein